MYGNHRVQRASRSRSLVDYLTRLGWYQDVKVKEGYLAGSPGTLLVQFWAVKGVLMVTPPGYATDPYPYMLPFKICRVFLFTCMLL